MTFVQCSAIKSNGQRCSRVAHEGSTYCHSHRNHADYSQFDPFKDLHLTFQVDKADGPAKYSRCPDCGRSFSFRGDAPPVCWDCQIPDASIGVLR